MYNFETMSMAELKAYVMNHRDDERAWAKYIAQLVASDPKWYPAPIDKEGKEIMNQAFRERFGSPEEYRQGLVGLGAAAGVISGSIAVAGQAAIATGAQIEQLKLRLQTTLGSEGAAEAAFKSIQAFAVSTPFQVSEVTEAFLSLKNRGIEPTNDVLGKLGDLASSQSKPLQQIIEGVLDASTGSNERLVELGIQAQQVGDKVRFTFKGMVKEVEKTPQAITEAIVSFGALEGVAGGMALQATSLTGKLSNLTDATETTSTAFF